MVVAEEDAKKIYLIVVRILFPCFTGAKTQKEFRNCEDAYEGAGDIFK